MTVQKPLDYIPINELSEEKSGGRVVSCITSWRKYNTGTVWGVSSVNKLVPDNWFKFHTQDMPSL